MKKRFIKNFIYIVIILTVFETAFGQETETKDYYDAQSNQEVKIVTDEILVKFKINGLTLR